VELCGSHDETLILCTPRLVVQSFSSSCHLTPYRLQRLGRERFVPDGRYRSFDKRPAIPREGPSNSGVGGGGQVSYYRDYYGPSTSRYGPAESAPSEWARRESPVHRDREQRERWAREKREREKEFSR
jgi:hypothetical protein